MLANLETKIVELEIQCDAKARRVINTAPDLVPNIDISTLVNGVTIEQLEAINVPVLSYKTQITIHGVFPKPDSRQMRAGLIHNQNKSLGVRYSAIDGAKKQRLASACSFSDWNGKWHVSIDSQNCYVYRIFRNDKDIDILKKEIKECYDNEVDASLYIGSKEVWTLMYGFGFAVVMDISYIYEKDMATFIQKYFRITEEQVEEYRQKRKEEYDAEEKVRAEERRINALNMQAIKDKFTKDMTTAKFKLATKGIAGKYFFISAWSYSEPKVVILQVTGNKRLIRRSFEVALKNFDINKLKNVNWSKLSETKGTVVEPKSIINKWFVIP